MLNPSKVERISRITLEECGYLYIASVDSSESTVIEIISRHKNKNLL